VKKYKWRNTNLPAKISTLASRALNESADDLITTKMKWDIYHQIEEQPARMMQQFVRR